MNLPKNRLGRGLEGLISGGVALATPPAAASVKIDTTRVEKSPVATPAESKLAQDLNNLLARTQAEVEEASSSKKTSSAAAPKSAAKVEAVSADAADTGFVSIALKSIKVSPYQKRKEFSAEAISELAASIRAEGLLQPIVVRKAGESYELIAGERRLRACKSLGLDKIPAKIVDVPNASAAVMGLIENLQRENLNPVDEARGYGMLLGDFHMTQEQIAERTGKARATVANSLRLLLLEGEVLGYVAKGQISVGHAKVLLGIAEASERVIVARKIIADGLSVRQTEALLRKSGAMGRTGSLTRRVASAEELAVVHDLEKRVQASLNAKVAIAHSAKGGKMTIFYKSNAELEGVLKRMGV